MQAINDNDNDNQDPIQELPNEMFTSILSLLPPPSIAQSSAISRLWRDTINSNPILHQEVDLTSRTARDLDLSVISGHFHRLASLSQNRLVKVSMDFSSLCLEWIDTWDPEDPAFLDPTFLGHFLSRIRLSKETLQELRFLIDGSSYQDSEFTMDFICYLLGKLKEFGSLRSIWIEAALFPLCLECGDKTPGSPQLDIRSRESDGAEIGKVIHFIRKVRGLMGKGLTTFSFYQWAGPQTEPDHLAVELFEELTKSKLEMGQLNVCDIGCSQIVWPFILQFKNLTDLQLLMSGPQPGENEVLRVPQDVVKGAAMKHLELEWEKLEVDWESVTRWIGSSLETLKLGIDSGMSRDSGFLFSNSYGSIVYNSQETLKVLHLFHPAGTSVFNADLVAISNTVLFFPNLEQLSLKNVNDAVFRIFSSLDSPKLHELEIESAYSDRQDSCNCLITNLQKHSSKIIELTVFIARKEDFPLTSTDRLNFNCLHRLDIKAAPKGLYDWLSLCQFHNLEVLSCEEERSHYSCIRICSCGAERAEDCEGEEERDRSAELKLSMPFNAPKLRSMNHTRIIND